MFVLSSISSSNKDATGSRIELGCDKMMCLTSFASFCLQINPGGAVLLISLWFAVMQSSWSPSPNL